MQARYRSSNQVTNFEATYTEILTDLKEMNCETPIKRQFFSPEPCEKRKKHKRKDPVALSGILGLASLISDRDLEKTKLPDDWFQPYPLITQISRDFLPTGIPLQGKNLLNASFDVYLKSRTQDDLDN